MGSQAVRVGDAVIVVDDHRPAAVVRRPDARDVTVAWPDLDVGWCTPTLTVLGSVDAAWAIYTITNVDSMIAQHTDPASVAVRIAPDGSSSVVHVPAGRSVGVTRHGIWTTPRVHPTDATQAATTVTLHAVDAGAGATPGTTPHTMTVDRAAALVMDGVDGGIDVLVHSAPTMAAGRAGALRATSALVHLPATSPLPDTLPTETAVVVDDATLFERLSALRVGRDDAITTDWAWRTVAPPTPLRHRAVAEALRQFDVSEPFTPGRAEYPADTDRIARVEGEWPDTVVALELEHPDTPSARLRREHRVFDASGRIAPVGYLSVYVMEDIATGKLPPASADDDVLTF